MIRHGSPGYAALEQYGHGGTTPRTDIYGLGATLYTLLTGVVPVDPVTRITESLEFDSLTPASLLNPTVPTAVAKTIQRAMSISERDRFESVEEFWQEITAHPAELHTAEQNHKVYAVAKLPLRLPQPLTVTEQELDPVTPIPPSLTRSTKKRNILLSLLAILLLVTGIVSISIVNNLQNHTHTAASPLSHATITPARRPLVATRGNPSQYPLLASLYGGAIY